MGYYCDLYLHGCSEPYLSFATGLIGLGIIFVVALVMQIAMLVNSIPRRRDLEMEIIELRKAVEDLKGVNSR
jgi:hypothetical protein|tara:strand:+ start:651 stop:866 length:216 start_codon:yes stop_codon:yes gene_type:complete